MQPEIRVASGLNPSDFPDAIAIYDQAFASKFSIAIPDSQVRRALFRQSFSAENCFSAFINTEVVGVLGYQIQGKSFSGGITGQGIRWSLLRSHLGFLASLRALMVFSLFERKVPKETLLLDGIAVREDCRGRGIGKMLLNEVISFAKSHSFKTIRLDVIESNPRAKALYEKMGFRVQKTHHFPYLKSLLGFSQSHTMVHSFNPPTPVFSNPRSRKLYCL